MGQVVLLLEEGRDLKGLLRTRLRAAETEQKARLPIPSHRLQARPPQPGFCFSKATPSHQIDPQCVPRNEPGAMRNRFPLSHRCFNSAKLPDKSRWDSSPRTLRKRKCSTTEQPCNSGKAPPCAPISAGS